VTIAFTHRQSAHCESGVTANLISHYGYSMSEAMVFGIGGGLFFGYFPFIKINHLPLITFRGAPGSIFKKCAERLEVQVSCRQFRNSQRGMMALDANVAAGIPTGVQTGVYWLPYFPAALRFHFNAHNLIVYGRTGDEYLISDPVIDKPVRCAKADLERARYAKGALAPKGRMYSIAQMPEEIPLATAIRKGIAEVATRMVKVPIPLIGVRGMQLLARHMQHWPEKLGDKQSLIHLGHLIRMQEEIGTGGGGFRFIYAAFLQEAAAVLEQPRLEILAQEMTTTGDMWRRFALLGARRCKGHNSADNTFPALAALLRACSIREEKLFCELLSVVKK